MGKAWERREGFLREPVQMQSLAPKWATDARKRGGGKGVEVS